MQVGGGQAVVDIIMLLDLPEAVDAEANSVPSRHPEQSESSYCYHDVMFVDLYSTYKIGKINA